MNELLPDFQKLCVSFQLLLGFCRINKNTFMRMYTFSGYFFIPLSLQPALQNPLCPHCHCETSKGGFMLLEGGFSYSNHRITGDDTEWQCVLQSKTAHLGE